MLIFRAPVTDPSGASDSNCVRIVSIDFLDALGYRGCGREEHSGENAPDLLEDLWEELADNRKGSLAREH